MLTGALKESAPESKIKVSADHVGHSQQLEQCSHGHYSKDNQLIFHSNSLLIAVNLKGMRDAMGDGLFWLFNMLSSLE